MKRPPKVRLAKPTGRKYQLRYTDQKTKREVRISTGATDEKEAQRQKKVLEAKLLLGIEERRVKRQTWRMIQRALRQAMEKAGLA